MAAGRVGPLALMLVLVSGCLRFGYEVPRSYPEADASQRDAGAARPDAAARDAATSSRGGTGGSAGRDAAVGGGGSGSGSGGSGVGGTSAAAGSSGAAVDQAGAAADAGAGIDINQMVGATGLVVSDILGFYSATWGDMVLQAHGDEIWGVYNYDGGTVVGQIASDGVFAGWWSQLPTRTGTDAGEVEFRWDPKSSAAVHFNGRWRYGTSAAWLTNWNLDRVTDRSPPSTLTDRFNDPNNFKRHP